jgi:hypothetical protein
MAEHSGNTNLVRFSYKAKSRSIFGEGAFLLGDGVAALDRDDSYAEMADFKNVDLGERK